MAKVATCYCMCNVNATGGDPQMIQQKRVAVCYGAYTGACNAPNRGEAKIRELKITDNYDMVATILIDEQQPLDYWQGCRCEAARTTGARRSMQQMNYTERQSRAADHCRPRVRKKNPLGAFSTTKNCQRAESTTSMLHVRMINRRVPVLAPYKCIITRRAWSAKDSRGPQGS